MADNRQYTALEWVVKEINITLQESQQVLESYAADRHDVSRLTFFQTLIHQVYGSLTMVGFHGAATLAQEIEELSQALLDNKISKSKEALELLMRATLQLPLYLDKIQQTKRDYPAIMLSLLNDVRSVRGADTLSESTLFSPNMSCVYVVTGNALPVTRDDAQLKILISKFRQMYQYAAAGVANQVDVDKNYEYLSKIFNRLGKLLAGTKRHQIWNVAHAVVDGLSHQSIKSTAGTRDLLRELDLELKELQKDGSLALNDFSSVTTIKNLLYYISCAEPSTVAIDNIKALYELDEMLPLTQTTGEQDELTEIDSSTLNAVTAAIREEFYEIKLKLDRCLYSSDRAADLQAVKSGIQRVNDILAILGFSELHSLVTQSLVTVDLLRDQSGSLTNDQLMELAHQLINIESRLNPSPALVSNGFARLHFTDDAQQVALTECRHGLEKSKEAIVHYSSTHWDIEPLRVVPELLRAVSGNLAILSLTKAAEILSSCTVYIESQLIGKALKPHQQQLESLADIVASVDYYIEFMSIVREIDESILDKAISGLVLLGVNIENLKSINDGRVIELENTQQDHLKVSNPHRPFDLESLTEVELAASFANDEDDFIDDELVDIFVAEVVDISETLDVYCPIWIHDVANKNSLLEIRRAFHTIKGGARMIKAIDVAELSWAIENLLNKIIDNTLEPNSAQTFLVIKVRQLLPSMVAAFKNRRVNPHYELSQKCLSWAALLAKGEDEDQILAALNARSVVAAGAEKVSEYPTAPAPNVLLNTIAEAADTQLWVIFHAEAEGHIQVVEAYIQHMESQRPLYDPPSHVMQRALHTLKGSAYMADLISVAELMAPLERFAKELRSYQVNINDDIFQLIKDGVFYTKEALIDISQSIYPAIAKADQFRARIEELRERSVGPLIRQKEAQKADQEIDPAVLEVLMAEEMHLLLDADLMIKKWLKIPATSRDWLPLYDELATLCHGAERANLKPLARLSRILQRVYGQFINGEVAANLQSYDMLLAGHSELMNSVDAIAAGQDLPQPDEELLQRLQSLPKTNRPNPLFDHSNNTLIDTRANLLSSKNVEDNAVDEDPKRVLKDNLAITTTELLKEDVDEDIIETFIEEARELLEDLDDSINGWNNGVIDRDRNELMQRILHTFKGGARLVGLVTLGDLSHDYETFLVSQFNNAQSDATLEKINQFQDNIIRQVDHVERLLSPIGGAVESEPSDALSVVSSAHDLGSNDISEDRSNTFPFAGGNSSLAILDEMDEAQAGQATKGSSAVSAQRNQPQEMVKVSANLMEELVNLAGETSISRGRMEEQIGELSHSLDDMDSTLKRLQEQIRRLDIETEAEVVFRQEKMMASEYFDSLEMDRYSQLQQLSRSLIESASDLVDLKRTLSDKIRDAGAVLLQQSRINTDLQEGLMRSRMVPFSRIVPRLRRIVRQISTELNKTVDLEIANLEGELDRSMMERMVAPLEHMLRNAIDHGIEDQVVRENAGKAVTGRVVISLDRDGSDVLILVADDGGGIDINRVRAKAIESNLIHSNTDLSDQDILQFILHAGFSTAETLTQISGRGVGMDVVNSEIRLMGGSIAINSELGKGTVFTIRVPFTVSVSRALMINMGEDRYAIPLNTIEGIVRVSPFELEHYYANPDELFQYANREYQLHHLGALLDDSTPVASMEGKTIPLPVILVRSADHSVAFQVDNLQGSREIVVKSLGPQFKSVLGVSGATIMGDGRVVVILDLNALIRSRLNKNIIDQPDMKLLASEKATEMNSLIMVVDDSITVRKVTSRLLEREGYDVITAKDGADAISLLHDQRPDVMLLDIEMPRMDGFEVTKYVRSSQHHQALPIIMITSRTGEKHRRLGLDAGANLYMGKPYQEEALLKSIRSLIKSELTSS